MWGSVHLLLNKCEGQGTFIGIGPLFPLCESWRWNSGHQVLRKALLRSEPTLWPIRLPFFLLILLTFNQLFGNSTSCTPVPLISESHHNCPLLLQPPSKRKQTNKNFADPSGQDLLLQFFCACTIPLLFHCNELLVSFKVSGFWFTINTKLSLRLHSYIQLLSWVTEILQLWFHKSNPFTCSSCS